MNTVVVPAQSYGARSVVGVDIDEKLIEGAWRRRRAVWSMHAPTKPKSFTTEDDNSTDNSPQRNKRKLQHQDTAFEYIPAYHYFPASCEHEFGSLPIPPSSNRGKDIFPHNTTFRTADWVKRGIPEDLEGYDVVVA